MHPHPPPDDLHAPGRLSRRTVLQWFVAAAAASQVAEGGATGAEPAVGPALPAAAKGYGTDPNLIGPYKPGDFWPLTLKPVQRATVIALADLLLPADEYGPAASKLRIVDFVDEWVSSPYPAQQKDGPAVRAGIDWLEIEAQARFDHAFAALPVERQRAICDDICSLAKAKPAYKTQAQFFARFRALAAGAYFSTPPGWKAIGYVGNVPLTAFPGPPPEVLAKLGLEQTVK